MAPNNPVSSAFGNTMVSSTAVKSVMLSVLPRFANTKLSRPTPPVNVSLPVPPSIVSLPALPIRVSLPSSPRNVLLLALPVMTLFSVLPVPLKATPVRVRFSMLAPTPAS